MRVFLDATINFPKQGCNEGRLFKGGGAGGGIGLHRKFTDCCIYQ